MIRVRKDLRLDGLKDLYRVHLDSMHFSVHLMLMNIHLINCGVGVIHGKETDILELMFSNGLMETLSVIFAEETDSDVLVCKSQLLFLVIFNRQLDVS